MPSLGELVTDAVSEIIENNITGVWLVAEAVTGGLQASAFVRVVLTVRPRIRKPPRRR